MRKLIASLFISVDGVMEGPGPQDPYEHAGWTMPYGSDEIGKIKYDELMRSDALLLGRITYEGFAAAWPGQTDEAGFADRMNNLPKYVVSTTLRETEWNNSHIINEDVAQRIAQLKEQAGQDILIGGSAQLINSLMGARLIDQFRLLVYPVILGSGKRLFHEGSHASLQLVESRPLGSGVVFTRYVSDATASN
ncbi:MAG: dihydrofolate reductase family protein [Anaerolineae bacterium]